MKKREKKQTLSIAKWLVYKTRGITLLTITSQKETKLLEFHSYCDLQAITYTHIRTGLTE